MKRHYWQYLIDSTGNAVEGAKIHVFLANTSNYAYIQLTEAATSYITSETANILTDSDGFFHFWISDEEESITNGYATTQKFDITFSREGYVSGIIEDVQIIWGGGSDEKVKINEEDTAADYLEEKIVAGDNITVQVSGDQIVITGLPQAPSTEVLSFTTTLSAPATASTEFDVSSFCNRCLVYKFVISVSGITLPYDVRIYEKDTFLTDDMVYELIEVSPATTFTDRLPFFLRDLDSTEELHIKIVNTDTNPGSFDITINAEKFN